MTVGLHTTKELSHVDFMQNINEVQLNNFKGRTLSKGEGEVVPPSSCTKYDSFSGKPLAQRSVSVAISRY